MPNVVDRLGGASSSLAFKAPCRLATTANITLEDFQTVDGVLPTVSEHVDLRRILVFNQTDQAENGIYIMQDGPWERTKDFDGVNDFRQGTRVYVYGGSTNSGTYLVTSSMDPSTFDFDDDDITFAEVGTFDQTTSALSLTSGGVISWDSGDVTITHSANVLAFAGGTYRFDNNIAITPSNAGIELGSTTTANTPFIDFHSGATGVDFDSRIIASSGSGASAGGLLGIAAARLTPVTDDGTVLGSSSNKWSDLFLASGGVINWNGGDVTITHSSSALAFAGAGAGYSFDNAITSSAITASGAVTVSGLITGSAGVSVNSSFTSSGNVNAVTGTTLTVGGVAGRAIMLFGSTTFGIYAGSSAPAIAAGTGSLYLRSDGTSSLTRAYIQSSGSTNTWVALLTTA